VTLHPEFNSKSSCTNCAAFEQWATRKDETHTIHGLCHRHAPRIAAETRQWDARGELVGSTEIALDGVAWPLVTNDSAMFCCEWLPAAAKASEVGL
jgi:hypothetical protein